MQELVASRASLAREAGLPEKGLRGILVKMSSDLAKRGVFKSSILHTCGDVLGFGLFSYLTKASRMNKSSSLHAQAANRPAGRAFTPSEAQGEQYSSFIHCLVKCT